MYDLISLAQLRLLMELKRLGQLNVTEPSAHSDFSHGLCWCWSHENVVALWLASNLAEGHG